MSTKIEEFYTLKYAEDYFNFFGIEYDPNLVSVKRFHILREYGKLIKTGMERLQGQERLLDFLKFSLLKVYGDFKNGYAPRAADVWDMFEDGKPKGCLACAMQGGNCDC
jgi:nitrogenase-stabilizing/protective protein